MQGMPAVVLIDRLGRRRAQHFGHVPDLRPGAGIVALIAETRDRPSLTHTSGGRSVTGCDEDGCGIQLDEGGQRS